MPFGDNVATGPEMLFVQSFDSGRIVPVEGSDNRYTIILEHGFGQTIYFSDRPGRIAGATPTQQFLDNLGFTPDNPPNAAILTHNGAGESTIAVVELFAPDYDATSTTLTYDLAVLDHWEDSTELGFTETPVDLDALGATFGATHLFIDGCPTDKVRCMLWHGDLNYERIGTFQTESCGGYCYSPTENRCLPCNPWFDTFDAAYDFWKGQCEDWWLGCEGKCEVFGVAHDAS